MRSGIFSIKKYYIKDSILKTALEMMKEYRNINGKNYLQIRGTAMGTKFAPIYANSVMGYLEQKLYQRVEENYGTDFRRYLEDAWKRYLDDCFLIWTKSVNTLDEFSALLNNLHPTLKFTREMSNTKLPFLDIMVIKSESENEKGFRKSKDN